MKNIFIVLTVLLIGCSGNTRAEPIKEVVYLDETQRITSVDEGSIVIFSFQIKDNSSDTVTDQFDIKINKKTIGIAKRLIKALNTYQEGEE